MTYTDLRNSPLTLAKQVLVNLLCVNAAGRFGSILAVCFVKRDNCCLTEGAYNLCKQHLSTI